MSAVKTRLAVGYHSILDPEMQQQIIETVREKYPEYFIPEKEALVNNEMRITVIGSGNSPVRRGQAATSILVELGNGDYFIFDAGGGKVSALWSLRVPHELLDKLFVTNLHLDYVGGIFNLWDSMGWTRNTTLHVWCASGSSPELGVGAYIDHVHGLCLICFFKRKNNSIVNLLK